MTALTLHSRATPGRLSSDLLFYDNWWPVVCFLLGNSPASEFYMSTFRNTLYVPSSQAGRWWINHLPAYEDGTKCSETSAYKIQTPGNFPEENIKHKTCRTWRKFEIKKTRRTSIHEAGKPESRIYSSDIGHEKWLKKVSKVVFVSGIESTTNMVHARNPAHHQLTLRRLTSYIYGAPILDVSRSHTTTQHSR